MSKSTGNEPEHWHDANGKHNMTDPRTIPGWPANLWDSDEREYVAHLRWHEHTDANPFPRDTDSEKVRELFKLYDTVSEQAEILARALETIAELIAAQRKADRDAGA